jgi:hypothetical protein
MSNEVYKKLAAVQVALKAPKGQRNNFGKYNYRSCEDILEAAKPLCVENGLVLIAFDDIVNIGDRYYVKAIVKVLDIETGKSLESQAFAREDNNKKGMDVAQITGASSSYARKYALNALFSLDDTKDADTYKPPQAEYNPKPSKPILNKDNPQWEKVKQKVKQKNLDINTIRTHYQITDKDYQLLCG